MYIYTYVYIFIYIHLYIYLCTNVQYTIAKSSVEAEKTCDLMRILVELQIVGRNAVGAAVADVELQVRFFCVAVCFIVLQSVAERMSQCVAVCGCALLLHILCCR